MKNLERLLIATGNKGKLQEFSGLFTDLPIEIIGLNNVGPTVEPEETGSTFQENALIKAESYAIQTGEWVLADDSGLEIAALDGAPGVHSARFGGEHLDHSQKIELVLDMLSKIENADRSARFVSVIIVARPDGSIAIEATGECRGSIAESPRGKNGFGYDPVFVPEGFDLTFGELRDEEKRAISHRGKAANEIIAKMPDFIGV